MIWEIFAFNPLLQKALANDSPSHSRAGPPTPLYTLPGVTSPTSTLPSLSQHSTLHWWFRERQITVRKHHLAPLIVRDSWSFEVLFTLDNQVRSL